jgi:hypothetical protein
MPVRGRNAGRKAAFLFMCATTSGRSTYSSRTTYIIVLEESSCFDLLLGVTARLLTDIGFKGGSEL